jgi:hypothetical protein
VLSKISSSNELSFGAAFSSFSNQISSCRLLSLGVESFKTATGGLNEQGHSCLVTPLTAVCTPSRTLFATSTLAVGANLPAYLVIIKRLNVDIT